MQLRLIALDLDGTAVQYEPFLRLDPSLIECLRQARTNGIRWVMNSDRSVEDMVSLVKHLPSIDWPVALLSNQREILFLCKTGRYEPHSIWNRGQEVIHQSLWAKISHFFPIWCREIEERFHVRMRFVNERVFTFMVSKNQVEALGEILEEKVAPWPEAIVSGNHQWRSLVHRRFSKGHVLRETIRYLSVDTDEVLAVGDSLNDMSMLNGITASLVGCPSNASPEVIAAVRDAGGVVATESGALGTTQVIKYFVWGYE